jgi:hypothetical protein
MSGTFSEWTMNSNIHAVLGPAVAGIVIAASLALAGCGAGGSLLRQDPQELAACDGNSAAQLSWEERRNWQRRRSDSGGCPARKAPRCDIQVGNRITWYSCE